MRSARRSRPSPPWTRRRRSAPNWPPRWPLVAPITHDEAKLAQLAKALDLDEPGWNELVDDAFQTTTSRQFERFHCAVSTLLEEGRMLDRDTLRRVKGIATEDPANNDYDQVRTKARQDMFDLFDALAAEQKSVTAEVKVETFEC